MRTNLLTAVMAGAVLSLSACGDGTGPGTGDATLSRAEALELNQAMIRMAASLGARDGLSRNTSPATQTGSGSFTFALDETAPCEPRGSVDLSGTVSVAWNEAGTGGLSADLSVAHDACAYRLDDGSVITLDGDPDIDLTMDATSGPDGVESITVTERGAFTWNRGDGNSGRCTVDLAAEADAFTGEVVIDGSFCGIDISGTYTDD